MTLSEKVAYLKGLADGMKLDKEKDTSRIIFSIIDILDEVALRVDDLDDNALAIGDELDAISDDLAAVEEVVYGEEDGFEADDWDWNDEQTLYDVECPSCGEEITVDEEMVEAGGINCPNCGEKLEFDVSECDECEEEAGDNSGDLKS